MKRKLKSDFKPLPNRTYDLNRFESYPHYVMNSERIEPPKWRCFAVLSPPLALLIMEIIQNHKDDECYICDIFEDDLEQTTTNLQN